MPPGVFNIIHGTVDTVNFICDAEDIKVIIVPHRDAMVEFISTSSAP